MVMQKLIDFISKHGKGSKGRLKIDPGDYQSEKKAQKARFYFHLYGIYLNDKGRIAKRLSLDDAPPNYGILLSSYEQILSPDYTPFKKPEKVYRDLYALAYFYDVLLFEVPSINLKTMLKMDFALLECIDYIVNSTAFSDGAEYKKDALKKAQARGMAQKYKERKNRVIELFDHGLRGPSANNTADKIIERMGSEAYSKTTIIKILKNAGRL
jgi:Arc/MetJ-type ribon-helix-helix transcriptional regulator